MARDRARVGAVLREKQVDAGEERARPAGAAKDPVERREHRRGRRIDLELRPERRVRDRHHETRRHPVARRVAEQHGEPPVRKRDEVVDVSADRVRDLVARPERIDRGLRELLRDEARLQVARELELVAEVDLVDELHPEQEPEQHGRRSEGSCRRNRGCTRSPAARLPRRPSRRSSGPPGRTWTERGRGGRRGRRRAAPAQDAARGRRGRGWSSERTGGCCLRRSSPAHRSRR